MRRALLLKPELTYKTALEEVLRVEATSISLRKLKSGAQSHTSCRTDTIYYGFTADSSDDKSESSDDRVYKTGQPEAAPLSKKPAKGSMCWGVVCMLVETVNSTVPPVVLVESLPSQRTIGAREMRPSKGLQSPPPAQEDEKP
ncbi:UNVERIFIED_CONTAM: hypothetical protein K2H54_017077 [Gekko kuhli]